MACDGSSSQQPEQTVLVFADLKHTGILTGPLSSSPEAPDEFGIAVPLPARYAGRDRWPDKLEDDDHLVERLGRLRIETTQDAGEVVVSIEAESRRSLRLFRNGPGGWRRQTPGDDKSWTFVPGKDRVVDLGVGVVIPEREGRPAAKRPGLGRSPSRSRRSHRSRKRLRVPFRVPPFVIPSALEPVDELLIVSQAVTAESVHSVRAFAARTGLKLVAHEVDELCDQWMQDTIEPGLFAFPTAEGISQARACLSGLRKGSGPSAARLDQQVATWLRRHGRGDGGAGNPPQ